MGSYDGAETSELVGAFLLHNIKEKYGNNFGLYRDDGLGISNASPRKLRWSRKTSAGSSTSMALRSQLKPTRKLWVSLTLNLANGIYLPYTKPNNIPLYIHKKSNHPPQIIKNIPLSINKRLSEISCDEASFNKAAPLYQKALDTSRYTHCLKFSTPPAPQPSNPDRKNRHRNIIWYNPPYSKNVATNLEKSFLRILDEEFANDHVLHKIFNRNTVKISYSCMSNIKHNIDGHNESVLSKKNVAQEIATVESRLIVPWMATAWNSL